MTPKQARTLAPPDAVYCSVRGRWQGWHTVKAVRPRDGYIKILGFHAWCPPHNFELTEFVRVERYVPSPPAILRGA